MKVSIVCQGASWHSWTPGDETWIVNHMVLRGIPHDMLWHMDDCRMQEKRAEAGNKSIEMLIEAVKHHPKVMTSTAYPDYPGTIAYPLKDIYREFRSMYFNSTVSYAVAYAIYKGFDEIHLYGSDFTYPGVYKAEKGRGCVEYWLGRATERGIKVVLPEDTTLMDMNVPPEHKPYGYDWFYMKDDVLYPKELPTAKEIEERYETYRDVPYGQTA